MNMILFFKIILTLFLAVAQEENESGDGRNSMALGMGPILPTNISGVDEIQSSWHFRYALAGSDGVSYELGYQHSNSNGVLWRNISLSFKNESDVESLLVQLYAGADYTMYEVDTALESLDRDTFGGHVGSAVLIPLSGSSFFRSDMKFSMKPGTSLYIGFGFEKRFSASDDADDDN
tara:strand:- start:13356 stop:13886 length:531 start_codon:yes stop_codon:yes gene_type:complete